MHSSSYRRPLSLHRSAESGGRFGRLCANLGGGLSVVSLCIAVSFALPLHTASAAPTSPADPGKVLRYVIPAAETGFDPAMTRDLYSQVVNQSVFEPLFTYDYLARPAKLVPLTAEALPEVSADGKTYTIRLKKGIYFSADPAFNGKRRELTQ